jgi:hypothetical protein
MSPSYARRHLLHVAGAAALTGLAGCSFGGSTGTGTGSGSIGFEVRNEITQSDIDQAHQTPDADPVVVHLAVGRVVTDGDNESLYEETVEVAANSKERLRGAFTRPDDGEMYAVNGRFEAIIDAEHPIQREDGFLLQSGGGGGPIGEFVDVVVTDESDKSFVQPAISVER